MPRLKGKGRDVVTARNNFVLKLVKCSESHDCAAQKRCHFLNFHANDPLYKFAKVIRKFLGMILPHIINIYFPFQKDDITFCYWFLHLHQMS